MEPKVKKRLVCVTGTDGSGKSTLLAHLAARVPHSRLVAIWDVLGQKIDGTTLEFKNREEAHALLESVSPLARAELIMLSLRHSLSKAMESDAETLLIDAYWFKYYSSELALFGETIRPTLENLVAGFPPPDVLFFLDLDPQTTLKRKNTFSSYEAGNSPIPTPENFITFQTQAYTHLKALVQKRGAFVLNGFDSVEKNIAKCLEILEEVP